MRELAIFSRQFATLVASGMPMLRTLHTLEEQTQDEQIRDGGRRRARRRRGRQLARAGDGAPPEGLRPALPGDGPLRRAVGPARGGARPDRLPGREGRRAAPPGQIGADVPGAGLRLRRRGADRDRRLRDPRLRQASSKNSPKNTPAKAAGLPAPTQICVGRLQRDHRLLVHHHPRPGPRLRRLLQMEEDRSRPSEPGTASS